eukprot:TRINITY_DN5818_c0_g1_i1.p1 TRINITY_DN5818_c0_g1~~TRINITY_DN5818_c0_g1_i1.p1  ORF type:complete len:451 (+),score=78.58 TRINITY_DN5818_c0_g1_i1:87-1439(+)
MNRLSTEQISQENQNSDSSAVTSLQLSHRALSDVSCLNAFCNLERLDLSFNNLSTLEGLKSCINLKWLSVAQNKLQSLKGVQGLSKLTVLNACRNKLTSMDEVRSLISLRALILNDNDIDSICRLDQLKYLNTLVLSRNPICDIGVSLMKVKSITKLSLSNCKFQSVGSSLMFCTDLKELRLAHNEIMILPSELAHNVKLQNLDLGNNLISNWSALKVLSTLHSLKNLNLQGNPIVEKDNLARKINTLVPNVSIFNGKRAGRGKMNKISGNYDSSINKDDLEVEKDVRRKKRKTTESSEKSALSHSKDENPLINDIDPKVKKEPEQKNVKSNEKVSKKIVSTLNRDENRSSHTTDLVVENVEETKLEGIDNGDTPFMELIMSSNARNPKDGDEKKRDHRAAQDVKPFDGLVMVSSKKKKSTKNSGIDSSAIELLLQKPEVGLGGPSTWDA